MYKRCTVNSSNITRQCNNRHENNQQHLYQHFSVYLRAQNWNNIVIISPHLPNLSQKKTKVVHFYKQKSPHYICCSHCFSSWSRSLLLISLVRDSFVTYFLLPVQAYVQWPFCKHFWHRTFSALGSLKQHIIYSKNTSY